MTHDFKAIEERILQLEEQQKIMKDELENMKKNVKDNTFSIGKLEQKIELFDYKLDNLEKLVIENINYNKQSTMKQCKDHSTQEEQFNALVNIVKVVGGIIIVVLMGLFALIGVNVKLPI